MNPQTSKRLRESDDEDAQNSTPEQKDGNGNGKTVIWKTRIISRCEEGYPLRLGDEHPVVPVEALDTETLPSCVSLEPKIGDPPSCDWPAFRRPKLRRFPDASSLELKTHLAEGVDGIVFRARSGDREVVVKMVCGHVFMDIRLITVRRLHAYNVLTVDSVPPLAASGRPCVLGLCP